MEGAARRAEHDFKLGVIIAWHTEAFARTKRLKKLSSYLGEATRPRSNSPQDLRAFFQSLKGQGKRVDIKKLN